VSHTHLYIHTHIAIQKIYITTHIGYISTYLLGNFVSRKIFRAWKLCEKKNIESWEILCEEKYLGLGNFV